MADVYVTALARARLDMDRLVKQKQEIDRQIARLTQTISGLSALVEVPVHAAERISENESLTKTVQMVFQIATKSLSPVEIRDKAEELGYAWKNPSNALNVIHTVLKRLIEKNEIVRVEEGGTAKYEFNIPF